MNRSARPSTTRSIARPRTSDVVNKNLALVNIGDGEFGDAGASTTTMTVLITYRLHDTLGL